MFLDNFVTFWYKFISTGFEENDIIILEGGWQYQKMYINYFIVQVLRMK